MFKILSSKRTDVIWGSTEAVALVKKQATVEEQEAGHRLASRSWCPPGQCASMEVQMFPARK